MKLKSRALGALAGLFAFAVTSGIATAADRPYTEGPVSIVTSVKVEPGMWDAYMSWLQSGWKKSLDAQKSAGIVLGYAVYGTQARTPDEPDLYLVVTYKNMAAFDGLDDRVDPIMEKTFNATQQQMTQAGIERGKMRTILGDEMIRELVLK
jgi:hypothetical protein